jgi:acyl-CoA synthetase (AMP-forming)/AMP-acid ligase II
MAARPESWPRAVDELLPNTLFKLAAQYPDLTYSEYPRTSNVDDGYRKVTYKEVANAVHAVAWWIDHHVGKPAANDGSETLVYMGPNDLRYAILVLGSVMVGYKVLSFLPRLRSNC